MNETLVKNRRAKTSGSDPAEFEILDLTSKAAEPWVRFSPFYPHGDIPVPFSAGRTAQSVEGIWQGLKVFESASPAAGRSNRSVATIALKKFPTV